MLCTVETPVVEVSIPNHLEKKGRTLSTELYKEREINPWKREKRQSSQRDEGRVFMLAVITAVEFCNIWHSGTTK